MGIADRESGRRLRRILRPQCRCRLKTRTRPRAHSALEQGRHSVRAANPLIANQEAAARSIEPRAPPPQFAFRLKRALGGRAGWGGFALQILFVAVLAWI